MLWRMYGMHAVQAAVTRVTEASGEYAAESHVAAESVKRGLPG